MMSFPFSVSEAQSAYSSGQDQISPDLTTTETYYWPDPIRTYIFGGLLLTNVLPIIT